MLWLSQYINQQAHAILGNRRKAFFQVVMLSLFGYTTWLAAAIVAFVTLRKGERAGSQLLLVGIITSFLNTSILGAGYKVSLISSLLTFVPCYIAAYVLRLTSSFRMVSFAFFVQGIIAVLLIELFAPQYILAQAAYIQAALQELNVSFLSNRSTEMNGTLFAHYLLGLQLVAAVLAALVSLTFARSIQSNLFYPGEFKREMLKFRADKGILLVLALVLIGTKLNIAFAVAILPLFLMYFLFAGLSLSFNFFRARLKQWTGVLLVGALLVLPFIMLPVYIIFGSLDSLFNFRVYLPSAGKTV